LSRAATQLAVLNAKLAGTSGPVSEALRLFIEQELGKQGVPPERVAARYAELLSELRRVEGLAMDLAVVRDEANRVEKAGAPRLATRLRSAPVAQSGDDPVFPASWRQAWTWARVKSHLDSIEAREELMALSARRRDLEEG